MIAVRNFSVVGWPGEALPSGIACAGYRRDMRICREVR
jgi:hypothetical protein